MIADTKTQDKLSQLLLLCWYLTVASAPFGDCLLRIALPIGGHFFLFRGMILLTCAVYLLYLIKNKENPLRGLSRPEVWFVVLAASMLVYGLVSVAWAISLGAWFTKFFTMCQMFAMTFLFLKLCRDEKVLRNTMAVMGVTVLLCALGGLAECWHGPFFDTPYRDYSYVFFDRALYAPIFTLYNPNGFATYLLFTLECLFLYMAHTWQESTSRRNKYFLWLLSAGMCLTLFLCCADSGRLSLLSIPVILLGLAVWLCPCYKRGLWVFVAFALMLSFIYIGENSKQVKYQADQFIVQLQKSLKTPEQPPAEEPTPPPPAEEPTPPPPAEEPTPPPPEKNLHGTLYTITPAVADTAVYESLADSDGVRVTLLKDCLQLLKGSQGLGIGLGNAELRIKEMDNTGGIIAVHCFIMEVLTEFGIFAFIPLLLLGLSLLKVWGLSLYRAIRTRNKTQLANALLLIFTALAYPLLSTANASSWGLQAMWFYLAMLMLYSGQLSLHAESAEAELIEDKQ